MFLCQLVMFFHHAFKIFSPDAFVKIKAVGHLEREFGNYSQDAKRYSTGVKQIWSAFIYGENFTIWLNKFHTNYGRSKVSQSDASAVCSCRQGTCQ
ncbi:hypothetical protein D3C84_896480 [compost metagenome]